MRKINVFKLLAILALGATTLYGQASRTWVSGVGDDANPCSRTAPCKTWAGAISKTAPGGEIDALDPGGFGALTITKSITLDGGGGQVASTLVSGTNGIVVAGATGNEIVIIRNIRINGLKDSGNGGANGIRFISGKDLNVENCVIFGFNTNGIDIELGASGSAHIVNTIIKNIGNCGGACTSGQGDGIFASTSAGQVQVGVDHAQVMVLANNGIEAGNNSRISVNNSFLEHAGGSGVQVNSSTGSQITVGNSELSFNANGITTTGAAGNGGVVGYSEIYSNSNLGFNPVGGAGGGTIFSYAGTNRVSNNAGGTGTFTSIPLLP